MWCVGELGLNYERLDFGHRFGGTDSEAFGALNPNRTIPIIQEENSDPIWESGAILRHLARQYGSDVFWPTESSKRTLVDQWAEWAKINIAMNFTGPVFWRVARTAPSKRDEKAIAGALNVLDHYLEIAETQLSEHAYLAGDMLTLADIQFGHILFRYFDIEITRPHRPSLKRYFDTLIGRPAYAEHVMVSYDALRALD